MKLTTYFCPVLHAYGNTSTTPFSKLSFLCNVTHSHSLPMFEYSLHSTSPWCVNANISGDPLIIFLNTGYSGCVLFHDTAVPKYFQNIFTPFSCDSAVVSSCQKRQVPKCSFRIFQLAFENIRQIISHTP